MTLDLGIILIVVAVILVILSLVFEKFSKLSPIAALIGIIGGLFLSREKGENKIKEKLNEELKENEVEYQEKLDNPSDIDNLNDRARELIERTRED